MLVDEAERAAKEVDARCDNRRPYAVVVEDERLHQIVGVALVVRRVDDASRASGVLDDLKVFDAPFDFPENRIQRMLERAVERIALRCPELFEIGGDAFAPVSNRSWELRRYRTTSSRERTA